MSCQSAIWEDDKYLVPVSISSLKKNIWSFLWLNIYYIFQYIFYKAIENDPMLMIDFDEFISNCNDTSSNNEMDQLQKKFQEQAKKIGEKHALTIYD